MHLQKPVQRTKKKLAWVAASLLGRNHWCHSWLVALLKANAGLLEHILEQGSEYLHYLCLINMGRNRLGYESEGGLVDMIRCTPKKQMLKAILDPCPDGLPGVLKNLCKYPLPRQSYTRLIKLMGDSRARKFLLHGKKISPVQLRLMEKLPHELRDCHVIAYAQNNEDIDHFLGMISVVHRLTPAVNYADMALSLRHISINRLPISRNRLQKPRYLSSLCNTTLHSWRKKQFAKKTFPDPPWSGNNWAKPVTNGSQLRHVARTMGNWIASIDYLSEVLEGESYFYVINQVPDTNYLSDIIFLIRKHHDEWHLKEAECEENRRLNEESKKYLLYQLRRSGFATLTQLELEVEIEVDHGWDVDLPDNDIDLSDGYGFDNIYNFHELQMKLDFSSIIEST